MPKETFLNLGSERKENIVRAALEEFARHPYEQASLSRIVKKSGIAKGSMYQYFEGKLGLYRYIVDLAYKEKKKFVNQAFELEGHIFDILEEYYRLSYLFAQEFPLQHQVTNQFWDSRAQDLHKQLEEGKTRREEDFSHFLEKAVKSGAVNPRLDPEAIFFVYHAVGKHLIDQFDRKNDDEFFKGVLDVLRYGLEVRKENNNAQK